MEENKQNQSQPIDLNKINDAIAKGGSLFSGMNQTVILAIYAGTAILLQILFLLLPMWNYYHSFFFNSGAWTFFALLFSLSLGAVVALSFILKKVMWYLPLSSFVLFTICLFSHYGTVNILGYLMWIVVASWMVFGLICNGRKVGL